MPKKESDYYIESDIGNWNMSANYIQDLHEKLKLSDKYRTASKFGCNNLFENFEMMNIPREIQKIEALIWFSATMKELCEDVIPLIKKGSTQSDIQDKLKKITLIDNKISEPGYLSKVIKNNVQNVSRTILSDNFVKILNILSGLRGEVIDIMNKNDLIFAHKEEFNHKDFKKAIKDRIRSKG